MKLFPFDISGTPNLIRDDRKVALLLFLIAFAFRLPRLFKLDVWFDEAVILLESRRSFSQIWSYCKTESMPPLYFWLLKV